MGGGGVDAPEPTAEEIAIQREQLELMRLERARSEALEPFVLASLGLVKETLPGQEERLAALREQRAGVEAQLAQTPAFIPTTGPEGAPSRTLNPARAPLERQLASLDAQLETAGQLTTLRRMTEEERRAAQTPIERLAEENLRLSLEREQRALRGELPISEGLRQQKAEEFRLFKEAQARAGNPIEGATPETAVATTTAGIQALRQFRQRFSALEDAARRGELSQGSALVAQRLGLTTDIRGARTAGLRGQPFGAIAGGLSGLLEPLEAQRALEFQARQAELQAQRQRNAAIGTATGAVLGGVIGSVVPGVGTLAGASIGAGVGGAGGTVLSTREAKKGIRRMSHREEDRALRMVRDVKTNTFRYIGEPDNAPKRMGLLAEEAPREIVTPDGKGLDVGRTIGLLTAATRALARREDRKGA